MSKFYIVKLIIATLIGFLVMMAITVIVQAGERVACETDYPRGPEEWRWAYRDVDGRPCWYKGRRKPVSELYWVHRPDEVVQPGAGEVVTPSATGSGAASDPNENSFEQRWKGER